MKYIAFYLFSCLVVFSCSQSNKEKQEFPKYEGPTMVVDSSTIYYSDSAVVRVKIKAPKQLEFENGNKEFPESIFIEFYEPTGELSSTLEANSAYYFKETDLYQAVGDVVVIGYLEPQKLNTEELFWEPKTEEIYTDKFVKIETEDQISTGNGLRAKQDFSTYRILKPEGTIYIETDSTSSVSSGKEEETVKATSGSKERPKDKKLLKKPMTKNEK